MFVHMNLKLLDGVNMSEDDLDFFGSVAAEDGESGGATDSVGEGGRGMDGLEEE